MFLKIGKLLGRVLELDYFHLRISFPTLGRVQLSDIEVFKEEVKEYLFTWKKPWTYHISNPLSPLSSPSVTHGSDSCSLSWLASREMFKDKKEQVPTYKGYLFNSNPIGPSMG